MPEAVNVTVNGTDMVLPGEFTEDEHTEIWQSRMREVGFIAHGATGLQGGPSFKTQ